MFSFILYSLMLVVSTMLVWLCEHSRTSLGKNSLLFFSFLIILIPSAIRYGVGTDFFSYYYIFDYQDWVTKNEYGFYFVNHIIKSLGFSAQWAIAAYAMIFTLIGFLSYPKKNTWVYHVLFISMLLFISFNTIRQGISIVFIMLAIKHELENKNLFFISLIIVASMFHQSALFFIPAVLLSRLPSSPRIKKHLFPFAVVGVTLLIWLTPSIFGIAHKIATQLNLPYQHYFESDYFDIVRVDTGLFVMIRVFFALILIVNSSKLLALSNKYWPIIVYASFYVIFYSLSYQSAVFGRFSIVYLPGVIYLIYIYIIHYFRKSNMWFFLLIFTFFVYLAPYFLTSFSIVKNPNNDNKYQTFFESNN